MRTGTQIFAWTLLLLGGAALAAPPAQPSESPPAPAPEASHPCPVRADSLAAWVPASFDAGLLVDLDGLRRALPEHGDTALHDHLLEPLARAGFPLAATGKLALAFRPYRGAPDAVYGVAEGPELAAAFAAWAGDPRTEEVHHVGDALALRARAAGGRLHFSLAGGAVAPFLRDDLTTRPEESLASKYPCMGDPDALYSLRVRRARPKRTKGKAKAESDADADAATKGDGKSGKPSGPIAWVRDYHLDLRAHGKGLEGVGHFEIQMPLRGFLWPLFGHLGMQTMKGRVEGCADDLAEDPAAAWIRTIEYARTGTGIEMRWAGPARELDAIFLGLRRIVRGEVGCSRRALPAALRTDVDVDVGEATEDADPSKAAAAPPAAAPPQPLSPRAPRGWLW